MIDANGNFIPDDSALFNTMPMAPPMPQQPQQPEGPGFFDRLGTGIKGAWNSGIDMMSNSMNDPRYPPGASPLAGGLAGLAQGFGQAAMPSRMPVPFGAALGMAAGGMQQGVNQSNRDMALYQQAQGQGLENVGRGIQNVGAMSQLPLMMLKNEQMQRLYSDPKFQQLMLEQMGIPSGGGQSLNPAPQLGGLQAGVQPVGSGKQGNPVSSAFDSIQDVSARRMALNAAITSGMSTDEIPAWIATVHPESNWNLKVADNKNPNGTYDMGVGQINSTHIGEGGMTEQQLRDPQNNLNKSAQIFHTNWANANGDPAKAIAAYNPGAGPDYTTKRMALLDQYRGSGGAQAAADQGGGGITQNASALAAQARQRAALAKTTGVGDPAVWEKQAEMWEGVATAGPKAQAAKAAEAAVRAQTEPGIAGAIKEAEVAPALRQAAGMAQIDIAKAGPEALAKAMHTSEIARPGSGGYIINEKGERVPFKIPELKEGHDPITGAPILLHASPAPVGAPPGTPGRVDPVLGPDGKPFVLGPTIIGHEFSEKYGSDLAEQFKETDNKANSAVANNFLFDNLRRDSQTWQMGKFANIEGNARAWLSAAAHAAHVPTDNETFKSLVDTPLSDYQAFVKSSGSLLRTAVHETSPRASTQEYNMIEHTLPSPTSSAQAFSQVADQWQAINDYQIAKQTLQHGYLSHPQDFNTDFNENVTPHSFMLNRMAQSPQGQQDMDRMLRSMQETPEGRSTAANMLKGYEFAKAHNLFQNLPPSMAQPPAQ